MTYFSQLSRYNKWLYFLISAFCALTIVANFLKTETTPLFVWGMYSEKEKSLNGYDIFNVIVNDSLTIDYSSSFTDANRFFLLSPLTYYGQIQHNVGKDPLEGVLKRKTGRYFPVFNHFGRSVYNDSSRQMAFKAWYINYLEGTVHLKINTLEVYLLHLEYNTDGRPELRTKTKIAL